LGSTSGTLALQLWATSTVYTGGSLFGYKLVESTIGTLQGGFYIDNIVRSGTIASVPSGNYNIVFVLAEWNGTAYVTVDYGNFNDRQNIGIVPVAPAITSQPTGVSAIVGQNVTFTVSASGSSSLSYQWRKNGTDILGATSASYTLSSVQLGDAANYSVVVSNSAGTVTSNNALLSVATPAVAPSITSHPTNQSVTAGTAVVFSVNASGTAPLTYQWRKDGAALAGATSSSLSIASASAANAGTYSVAVSNSAGSVISNSATLTVTEPLFSRIGNVSIRTTLSDRQLLIVGLTMSGGEKPVLVRAVGLDWPHLGSTTSCRIRSWVSSMARNELPEMTIGAGDLISWVRWLLSGHSFVPGQQGCSDPHTFLGGPNNPSSGEWRRECARGGL
jgi:hypothetical protein